MLAKNLEKFDLSITFLALWLKEKMVRLFFILSHSINAGRKNKIEVKAKNCYVVQINPSQRLLCDWVVGW